MNQAEVGKAAGALGPVGESARFWFRCPGCGVMGTIDDDQRCGSVSIDCDACPYHETHDWRGKAA